MLPRRYRRSPYMQGVENRNRRGLVPRLIAGLLALLILWFIGSKVLSFFRRTFQQSTGTILNVDSSLLDGVQVSLQGAQAQTAQDNLKIYAGDSVLVRPGGGATLTFFDGSRMRLDQGTQLSIESSEKKSDQSVLSLRLLAGRAWIATPDAATYSGSIVRTLAIGSDMTTDIPADTQAMVTADRQMTVVRASGIGLHLSLPNAKGNGRQFVVGEGQFFSLEKSDALKDVLSGSDPYKYRDAIPVNMLRDAFLVKSYSLLRMLAVATTPRTATGTILNPDLRISAPLDNAVLTSRVVRVTGKVSEHVQSVVVNNNPTAVQDGTFSLDVNLPGDGTQIIHIEAKDEQGVLLTQTDVSVKIGAASSSAAGTGKANLKAVRITAPGGNDETVTVNTAQVDITGEAPVGAQGIMVNDYQLQLFRAGSKTWSYLANADLGNMNVGKNIFTIWALDKDGNKGEPATITVNYQPLNSSMSSRAGGSASSEAPIKQNPPLLPGSLQVTKPATGTTATVTDKEVVIEGTTAGETDTLSINGYKLQLYQSGKTTWNYIASTDLGTMKDGRNVYRIVTRNKTGEILDVLEYVITKQ